MSKLHSWFFIFSMALFSSLVSAKPLPTKYAQMKGGHVTPQSLQALRNDSDAVRSALPPDAYRQIVQDPYHNARSEGEMIAALAAREIIYMVDRSGSMSEADTDPTGRNRPNWTRWKSAFEAGKSLFEVALSLDSNGALDVVLWNGENGSGANCIHQEVRDFRALEQLFTSHGPTGSTPLAEALDYIYLTKLKGMLDRGEPFTVVILTDGVPGSAAESEDVAKEKVYQFFRKVVRENNLTAHGRETLAAFTFVQSGDEVSAEQFLTRLDDEMKGGYRNSRGESVPGLGIDIIDYKKDNFIFGTTPYENTPGVGPLGIFWGAMFD